MNTRPGRLGIGIIGAGHVGPILGAALAGAGHAIIGISAISQDSRDRAEAILPAVPILPIPEIVERSELVILAVPDDQLETLIAGLAAAGTWQQGQLVLHTSARFGTAVLQPAFASGIIPLAIHPAMSFTGTSIDIARLSDSYFAVTAPTPVLPIAQALVVEMGGEPVVIGEADRPSYAESVETATAFATSIVEQAARLLSGIGVDRPGAVIAPLVRSAMENALARTDHDATDRALLAELAEFGSAADDFGQAGDNGYGAPRMPGAPDPSDPSDPSATSDPSDPDSSEDQ